MKNDPRSCQRNLCNCVRSLEKKSGLISYTSNTIKKSNNLLLISKANYKILFTGKFRLKNYLSESNIHNSFRLKKSTLFGFKKFSLIKKCYSN